MKYDNIKAFAKHLESAAPQHFANIYFILGKETLDGKEAGQILLRYLLPDPLALRTFDANHLTSEELLLELNSISFFISKKVIWIQQADKLKKNVQEALEVYVSNPQRSTYLILSASHFSKTSTFYKKVEKIGVVLELSEPKPWEKEKHLVEWVGKQAVAARKVMAYPACQLLVKGSSLDYLLLEQEWQKLLCYIGEKTEITEKDVWMICTHGGTQTVWQLGEAIFRFDAPGALAICQNLLMEGHALLPLLRQVRTQLQTGYHICTVLAQEGSQISEISQEYPYMKGQILERNVQFARQYGSEKFKKALLAIDEAEMHAKNSQIEDHLIAELLMIKLTTN